MTSENTKTAVITGGNRGIGADISRRFLDKGYAVVNISREEPEWKHDKFVTVRADLSDLAEARAAAEDVSAHFKVTTFVHNAGVIRPDLLEDIKLDDLEYLTNLHLGSAIILAQKFVPTMRESMFGRIVLISSRGVLGLVTRTNYAATKAGQIGITRTWALELAESGVTVNCVAPGPIETDMFHELVPEDDPRKEKIAASVPVKRLGTPEDIGRVVAFLCEPESGFITGQTWYICGGASLGALSL
jgi:NAD(P)-dependent dehydrogenase (short-subunit alcohol dehydrogenase family)